MSIPFFYPPVIYVRELSQKTPFTIRQLCQQAGIVCKASGSWADRLVEIVRGKDIKIVAEPGDWGKIRIEMQNDQRMQQARLALAVLAYGMHDLVAKQSISGHDWANLAPPRGRPKKARALSVSERQRRFREKRRGTQI